MAAAYLVDSRGTAGHVALLGLTVTVTHRSQPPWAGWHPRATARAHAATYTVGLSHVHIAPEGYEAVTARADLSAPGTRFPSVVLAATLEDTVRNEPGGEPGASRARARDAQQLAGAGRQRGVIPCPSALVVLLSAIAFHRVGVSLILIIAFSAGLAVVLTAIGLLMVYGHRPLSRVPRESRLLGPLGIFSALAVAPAGLVIAVTSLVSGGVFRF